MQLGMVGLGRMGAKHGAPPMKAGHDAWSSMCPQIGGRVGEGKKQSVSSLQDFAKKLNKPRAVWLCSGGCGDETIAGILPYLEIRRHPDRRRQLLLHRRHPPVRKKSRPKGHQLRRRRYQRRRVGPGARLLADDRRPRQGVQYLDPIFKTLAPGHR